jgi:LmbE family N-acetylglucosaminyl deacetylase
MLPFSDEFLGAQRLLVITPHADDETYGCAGTMARVKAAGGSVYVVLATAGDVRHYADADAAESEAGSKLVTRGLRLEEFGTVMKFLGVDDWELLLDEPEAHLALDTIPRKRLVGLIESTGRLSIDQLRPTMIMIPAVSYNQDHEVLYQACVTATRPGAAGQKYTVPFVLVYDNTSLFWPGAETRLNPNVYIDISDYLNVKIEAMRLHRSQVRDGLYHGSPEMLEMATRVRGSEVSVPAAEGFVLLRGVF